MIDYFVNLSPLVCAIIATTFTFLLTALGSSVVFFVRKVNDDILDYLVGFSSGIMLAASVFSLINPAIDASISLGYKPYIVCSFGFIIGAIFLFISDKFIDKKMSTKKKNSKSKKSIIMLIFSITLHNIPEGMAIGVAFGSLYYESSIALLLSAFLLAFGIGIQNFPEGSAVSLPLKANGLSSIKSFLIGSATALVEPISGIIGVILVLKIQLVMPILLTFAASAMIYVVISELIPSTQEKNKSLVGLITIIGFIIMMILDLSLS